MNLQNGISLGVACYLVLFLYFMRPYNKWHFVLMRELRVSHKIVIVATVACVITTAIMPMSLSPYWNGSVQKLADKQQYDRLGDALLQGHLYIDKGDIDPALKAMQNPYDKEERERLGVKFHWDEAYYNNHYYMYFGIVPTLVLFIPYKLLTGSALLSYQATQIFATLTIIGFFYLFYILCKSFFPQFPFSQYLLLSSLFSIISIGYSIAAPALYCTAIVSGICMMIWSIVCFLKGAWLEQNVFKSNWYLVLGALLGALAFGCRPPVALANVIVLAVIYQVWKNTLFSESNKVKKLFLLFAPYLVVGVLLMLYNYARFDNVFEFGQSYQLTLADQHNYGSFLERFDLNQILKGFWFNLYLPCGLSESFPYLRYNGFFVNYPILLLSAKLFSKHVSTFLKERKLYLLSTIAFLTCFIIVLLDVYWSPFLSKRYHLDFLYLLCIVTFIAIASWSEVISGVKRKYLICGVTVLTFLAFAAEFLFFCIPFDGNYTMCYPEKLEEIYRGLRFGM